MTKEEKLKALDTVRGFLLINKEKNYSGFLCCIASDRLKIRPFDWFIKELYSIPSRLIGVKINRARRKEMNAPLWDYFDYEGRLSALDYLIKKHS